MLAIYGKKKTDKNFRILGDGSLEMNIINGMFYPDTKRQDLETYILKLEDANPEFKFEIRPYKGDGTLFPEEELHRV